MRCPHLVLADVRENDAVGGQAAEKVRRENAWSDAPGRDGSGSALSAPHATLATRSSRAGARGSLPHGMAGIVSARSPMTGSSHGRTRSSCAGSISKCDDAGMRGETGRIAGDSVVEPRAEDHQQIGFVQAPCWRRECRACRPCRGSTANPAGLRPGREPSRR